MVEFPIETINRQEVVLYRRSDDLIVVSFEGRQPVDEMLLLCLFRFVDLWGSKSGDIYSGYIPPTAIFSELSRARFAGLNPGPSAI